MLTISVLNVENVSSARSLTMERRYNSGKDKECSLIP